MTEGVRDAELMSVGPDEIVVTFSTDSPSEARTRIGDEELVTTGPHHVARVTGLEPATEYPLAVEGTETSDYLPATVTTLARPAGRLLATVATANDVHVGEIECGKIESFGEVQPGPVFCAAPGDPPYPRMMNEAAVAEIAALDPDAVVVKGDLTTHGTREEFDEFMTLWSKLGPRFRYVRGNHDAYYDPELGIESGAPYTVALPGVVLAVIDTTIPGKATGAISTSQLEWLESLAAASSDPVLVFGHHHVWSPSSPHRHDTYFGVHPDSSEALIALAGRREAVAGYFAGHTHRNRIRRFRAAREIPFAEVACLKDYPGAWAEYRVYEGGYTQVVRRVTAPGALAWTEKTRGMFQGLYRDYALGGLADRCFSQAF
jgi:predicted phosphodiesterase